MEYRCDRHDLYRIRYIFVFVEKMPISAVGCKEGVESRGTDTLDMLFLRLRS